MESWDDYSFEVVRIWGTNDAVFVPRQHGRGKRSGVPIDDEVTFALLAATGVLRACRCSPQSRRHSSLWGWRCSTIWLCS